MSPDTTKRAGAGEPTTVVQFRAGWSKTRLTAEAGPILDVGSGAYPHPLATVLCDRAIDDDTDRHGAAAVVDSRLIVADGTRLPFPDKTFAFVIASHIAEHVDDPAAFCRELQRVARAGYIETPSALAETVLPETFHRWKVSRRGERLVFSEKSAPSRRTQRLTDLAYSIFYIGQHDRGRDVLRLPGGLLGTIVSRLRWLIVGTLTRSHILHTRMTFTSERSFQTIVRRR